jgi:hypothetical protein
MAARIFVRLALVIALARRYGLFGIRLASRFLLRSLVLGSTVSLAFFASAAISGGLFSAFLFAVFGGSVIEVGFGDSPPPSRLLTFAAAVPIEGMIGREIAIAPLEQAFSRGGANGIALRLPRR